MKKICPLCNGAGQYRHFIKHKQTGKPMTVIGWCLCKKSKLVSESPSYSILAGLGDYYLHPDKIDPQLKFDLDDLGKSPNLLILSETNYETFLLHIKSFIMMNRFNEPAPAIYACDSIDILKRFYVAQEDGSCPSLAGTNKYDLLIFTVGVDEKNDQLNTCVSQVVANRRNLKKPTWIYLKKPYDLCVFEKSEALSKYLEISQDRPAGNGYLKINLKNVFQDLKKSESKTRKSAENFKI